MPNLGGGQLLGAALLEQNAARDTFTIKEVGYDFEVYAPTLADLGKAAWEKARVLYGEQPFVIERLCVEDAIEQGGAVVAYRADVRAELAS